MQNVDEGGQSPKRWVESAKSTQASNGVSVSSRTSELCPEGLGALLASLWSCSWPCLDVSSRVTFSGQDVNQTRIQLHGSCSFLTTVISM